MNRQRPHATQLMAVRYRITCTPNKSPFPRSYFHPNSIWDQILRNQPSQSSNATCCARNFVSSGLARADAIVTTEMLVYGRQGYWSRMLCTSETRYDGFGKKRPFHSHNIPSNTNVFSFSLVSHHMPCYIPSMY